MPFSLHEMAIEYRIAARPAPSCEPKNIEFLLDSDMYLWILSISVSYTHLTLPTKRIV